MTGWLLVTSIASAAIGGAVLGALAAIHFKRWRDRAWLRFRCRDAAAWIQEWFGSPLVLRSMTKRIHEGHDFTVDRQWRREMQERIERVFCVRAAR